MALFSGKASEMIHVLLNALYENKKTTFFPNKGTNAVVVPP